MAVPDRGVHDRWAPLTAPRACRDMDLDGLTASTGIACVWIGHSQHRIVTSAYNAGVRSSFNVPLRKPALLGAGGGAAGEERAALQAQIAASAEVRAAGRRAHPRGRAPARTAGRAGRGQNACAASARKRGPLYARIQARLDKVSAAPQGARSGAGESAQKAGRAGGARSARRLRRPILGDAECHEPGRGWDKQLSTRPRPVRAHRPSLSRPGGRRWRGWTPSTVRSGTCWSRQRRGARSCRRPPRAWRTSSAARGPRARRTRRRRNPGPNKCFIQPSGHGWVSCRPHEG